MAERALVRNAADPRQVRFAERIEASRVRRFEMALNALMGTGEGRIVMAQLIRRAGVYESVWSRDSAIHYKAGRQDYGHELMADLVRVNEQLYQQMERDEWAWVKSQNASIDAQHTKRASEKQEPDDER